MMSKKFFIISLILFGLIINTISFSVNAGCDTEPILPVDISNSGYWDSHIGCTNQFCLVNIHDNNISSNESTENVAGVPEFVVLQQSALWYEYYLKGVRIRASELNLRFMTYHDTNLSIVAEKEGVPQGTEGSFDIINGQWNYINFTQGIYNGMWSYNIELNFTWNQQILKSKLVVYEIQFMYYFNSDPAILNAYPTHTEQCVKTCPEIQLRISDACGDECGTPACLDLIKSTIYEIQGSNYINISYMEFQTEQYVHTFWHNATYFNASEYGTTYYYCVNITDGSLWTNQTYYFKPNVCLPPESPPNHPCITGLNNQDCWEIISIFNASNTINKNDTLYYNSSNGSFIQWKTAVNMGLIYNGVFEWNSDTYSYDNISDLATHKGYFVYFYDQNGSIANSYDYSGNVNRNDTSIDSTLLWVLTNILYAYEWNGTNANFLTTHNVQEYAVNITGGSCDGMVYVNYTDDNLSIWVTVNKTDNSNTTEYSINEDNWLFMAGMNLEPQLLLFIAILTLLWIGAFKEDLIIGFLCCYSAGFTSLTAMIIDINVDIIDNNLLIVYAILMFISFAIGTYKAYIYRK